MNDYSYLMRLIYSSHEKDDASFNDPFNHQVLEGGLSTNDQDEIDKVVILSSN